MLLATMMKPCSGMLGCTSKIVSLVSVSKRHPSILGNTSVFLAVIITVPDSFLHPRKRTPLTSSSRIPSNTKPCPALMTPPSFRATFATLIVPPLQTPFAL